LWKREAAIREFLELHARQLQVEGSNLPWLCDGEWRAVFEAEDAAHASAETSMEASSVDLIQQYAPLCRPMRIFFGGRAQKCFRCGKFQGFLFDRKGLGWRERTHDDRCRSRMLKEYENGKK
jgi:hypothetical protein